MQLFLLDKNPVICANMLPDKYLWSMTKELGQLISSIMHKNYTLSYETSEKISRYIPQGPELREFIMHNSRWIILYYSHLISRSLLKNPDPKPGIIKAIFIKDTYNSLTSSNSYKEPDWGYFRCSSSYYLAGKYKDIRLNIDLCCKLYKEYLEWKIGENKCLSKLI